MIYKDKVYTVAGDFHENADALDHLLSEYKNTQIVLLGDYFDSIGGNAQEMAEVMTDLANGEYHLKYDPINDTPIGDMMWLRDYYYFEPSSHTPLSNKIGKTVVSGHTPTQEYGLGGKIMRLNAVGDNQDMTRYVIDGGSNSGEGTGHVNIVQFTETGKFIDVEEV